MEVTLELVQQLREYADVSFTDAKAALEATGGDLLEALIWLEKQGKIDLAGVGSYQTGPAAEEPEPPREEQGASKVWRVLTENRLTCYRGERLFEVPLVVLLALFIFAGYVVVIGFILGLCTGWRFRFSGPELSGGAVNEVMDNVSDGFASLWENIRRGFRKDK